MKPTTREFAVDIEARTVTHRLTGLVMKFERHADGGWIGHPTDESQTLAVWHGGKAQELAAIASRAGDAWAAAQHK